MCARVRLSSAGDSARAQPAVVCVQYYIIIVSERGGTAARPRGNGAPGGGGCGAREVSLGTVFLHTLCKYHTIRDDVRRGTETATIYVFL